MSDWESDEKSGVKGALVGDVSAPVELPHEPWDARVDQMLANSVAFQMSAGLARGGGGGGVGMAGQAFQLLLQLVEEQLSGMVTELHRIATVQRRQHATHDDVALLLQGFQLTPEDIEEQMYLSKKIGYNRMQVPREQTVQLQDATGSYDRFKLVENQQLIASGLSGSDMSQELPIAEKIPAWLPKLPPNHTYKFTTEYNKLLNDEKVLKEKIIKESMEIEVSLSNLVRNCDRDADTKVDERARETPPEELKRIDDEIVALYGPLEEIAERHEGPRTKRRTPLYLKKSFDVQAYSLGRVKLARNAVQRFEWETKYRPRNPFLCSHRAVPENSKKVYSMLENSLNELVQVDLPRLESRKAAAIAHAVEQRDAKLAELRAKLKETTPSATKPFQGMDINIGGGGDDDAVDDDEVALFEELSGSSDDDDDGGIETVTKTTNLPNTQGNPMAGPRLAVVVPEEPSAPASASEVPSEPMPGTAEKPEEHDAKENATASASPAAHPATDPAATAPEGSETDRPIAQAAPSSSE
ncbi:Taf8p KNAG_0G03410 [Huiozyma naganishii CBS 8797]|uniref:Transcription initiation factor TFIID subunit 8 n=1 Tax=Huiozyma naganishii (strain ATCC MYA-139 / BCRC 22969 / CBS 8797 / KCTC 17520 / NBRC 10181 / NCYC 3082 / Yp74L-3) TaxID=1071383 RepID=J7S881_HUIN7|nr:hypothetical protein KNAG_0G03410 [Kazachstania naganishii CBS 8797]CCK71399.1 hypothetical protein KNAG_0G03410 [Kazachstania naganishii CBS 8797]